jgi:hypothetical protein
VVRRQRSLAIHRTGPQKYHRVARVRFRSKCGRSLFQIMRGELVFSIPARHFHADSGRDRNLSGKVRLARLRQQMNFRSDNPLRE